MGLFGRSQRSAGKPTSTENPEPVDDIPTPRSESEKQTELVSPEDVEVVADESYKRKERALLRKLDWHLLPGVCVLYLLSFLDRSNVANARLDGLTDFAPGGLYMTGNQYLTGLTVFFIGYILFEVIWNIILKRVGPRIWLPLITFVWGIVATLQGVVQYNGGQTGVAGFFVVRFFLGLTEGGLFPGVVFYLR